MVNVALTASIAPHTGSSIALRLAEPARLVVAGKMGNGGEQRTLQTDRNLGSVSCVTLVTALTLVWLQL